MERKRISRNVPIDSSVGGINEIYAEVKKAKLPGIMEDPEKEDNFTNKVQPSYRRGRRADDHNVLFLQSDTTQLNERELQFVTDIAHGYSDIVPIPLVEDIRKKVSGRDSPMFQAYLDFVREAIRLIETRNNKPLMGTIPVLPYNLTEALMNLYLDEGVRAFCVDFDGRTPSATDKVNLRPLRRRLQEEDIEDEVLFYALNVNRGRSGKDHEDGVSPSQDILAFGFGFDILGQKHMRLKGPPEMFQKMQAQGPRVQIFDKDGYAYRKTDPRSVARILPHDSSVTARDLATASKYRRRQLTSAANMEQQSFESKRLHDIIEEERVGSYLREKSELPSRDLRKMADARDVDSQPPLDKWF